MRTQPAPATCVLLTQPRRSHSSYSRLCVPPSPGVWADLGTTAEDRSCRGQKLQRHWAVRFLTKSPGPDTAIPPSLLLGLPLDLPSGGSDETSCWAVRCSLERPTREPIPQQHLSEQGRASFPVEP